jgi:Xaa-Pro aminopeptidase
MTRLARLSERLDERLLVTNLDNIRYLTGFDASNAALLVDPGGDATLFTDFRYFEAAQAIAGVDAQETKRALLVDLAERLDGTFAFEADVLPFSQVETLRQGGLDLVPLSGAVEALRAVKDEDEIAAIRRAVRAAERAFEALTAETWVGRTERDLAWRLHQLMHANGADRPAFEVIATGTNGSKPHAEAGEAIVGERMLVVADFGAQVDGYYSDCTRTLATGKNLPKELRRAYEVCLEAQLAACAEIRPGMTGAEADTIARRIIADADFGNDFGHGLGHGIGIAIHEAPRLAKESTQVLEVGNVITIEPGIYLRGIGGVRIEDLGVIREHGVELLTAFPKELTLVG